MRYIPVFCCGIFHFSTKSSYSNEQVYVLEMWPAESFPDDVINGRGHLTLDRYKSRESRITDDSRR